MLLIKSLAAFVFLSVASKLFAVDLDALERLSAEATRSPSTNASEPQRLCNDELQAQVGHDLPADFNPCAANAQYLLIKKGLYLGKDDEVKPLPASSKSSHTVQKVIVPDPSHDPVDESASMPIVLDIENVDRAPGIVIDPEQRSFGKTQSAPPIRGPEHRADHEAK